MQKHFSPEQIAAFEQQLLAGAPFRRRVARVFMVLFWTNAAAAFALVAHQTFTVPCNELNTGAMVAVFVLSLLSTAAGFWARWMGSNA
jgi:hypothetical protein